MLARVVMVVGPGSQAGHPLVAPAVVRYTNMPIIVCCEQGTDIYRMTESPWGGRVGGTRAPLERQLTQPLQSVLLFI